MIIFPDVFVFVLMDCLPEFIFIIFPVTGFGSHGRLGGVWSIFSLCF